LRPMTSRVMAQFRIRHTNIYRMKPKREKEISKEVHLLIRDAIDKFIDSVKGDEINLFDTDGHMIGYFNQGYSKLLRRIKNKRPCIYPECQSQSILFSHSIQRAGILEQISEKGHVCCPEVDANKGLIIKKIGINEASTFPGYCKNHELLFAEIEHNKSITNDDYIKWQVFRTICKEIVIKEIELNDAIIALNAYNDLIAKKFVTFFKKEIENEIIREYNLDIKKFKAEGLNFRQKGMNWGIDNLKKLLRYYKTEYLPRSLNEIEDREDTSLFHFKIEVMERLPVVLAGIGNFHIDDHGTKHNIKAILNVLTLDDKTIICATVLYKYRKYLEVYINEFMNKLNGPLVMVETWMVNGTDHWFITPSEWENIPKKRQDLILKDLLEDKFSLSTPYPNSILDSVRRRMLSIPFPKEFTQEEIIQEKQKIAL
jgi:hypothetical protein